MRLLSWMVSGTALLLIAIVCFRKKNRAQPPEETTAIYTVTDLGALGAKPYQGKSLEASNSILPITAINNAGQVVGTIATDSGYQAFTWREGVYIDLNYLISPRSGWHLEKAISINDAGHILGQGHLKGELRHFLLIPVSDAVQA